jgi:hypothetical protein
LLFIEETAKPTLGNFLFGAKTAKLLKPDGDGEADDITSNTDATTNIFDAIFGKGDEEEDDPIKKKALWKWQEGHN